jgi:endonuclease/exonuclease/phosphatase family metal-dependent hydrolase
MPLKVLTRNLWHNAGPYPARRERIRAWLSELSPDVIGFQEVLRGPQFDQAAELLDGCGYHVAFVSAVQFWNDPSLEYGNVIAARWPIADQETLRLPDGGDGELRSALSVTIDAPFGPLSVTCTHLNWKLHQGWVRERQVVAVCQLALRRRPRGGFPPILLGDFNAEPDSTEIRYIKGLHALNGASVHFRDVWRMAGEGEGITWSNENDYARPALEPDRRIDYIFVGPPLPSGIGKVESCRVVCNDGQDGVWPTDHFGVYAELRTEPLPR